jgi:glycosyltransferase involved in cell wall biosynthesis
MNTDSRTAASLPAPERLKVLLLVENNGYPRDFRVRREAQALFEHGCQVEVVCPREEGQGWHEVIDGVEVFRFPAPPNGTGVMGYLLEFGYATLATLALSIWVWLRRGVDIVHAANPPDTLFLVGAVFKLMGKRFIFDHHDLSPEVYQSRFSQHRPDLIYRCLRWLEAHSIATADVVVATNESYSRRAISVHNKPREKVFIVRNGPPLSFVPLDPPPQLVVRAAHLIGYVGTIGPQDGLDCWIRAIGHMVHSLGRRDFLAFIIGDGDALPAVRRLASELDVESYVHFTGRLPEDQVRSHLSAATLCVQPDPSGPLNDVSTMNKLMEYMALGKPTVSFDLPETRVSGGDAVAYARANDENEFAREVCLLLDDPDRRAKMGKAGRERVSKGLAWEHSVPELIRAYTECMGTSCWVARRSA